MVYGVFDKLRRRCYCKCTNVMYAYLTFANFVGAVGEGEEGAPGGQNRRSGLRENQVQICSFPALGYNYR